MAQQVIPVATIQTLGIVPSAPLATDAVNDNVLSTNNGSTTFVRMITTTVGAKVVTIVTPYTARGGEAIADDTYNLGATIGSEVVAGPFPFDTYGPNVVIKAPAGVSFIAQQI